MHKYQWSMYTHILNINAAHNTPNMQHMYTIIHVEAYLHLLFCQVSSHLYFDSSAVSQHFMPHTRKLSGFQSSLHSCGTHTFNLWSCIVCNKLCIKLTILPVLKDRYSMRMSATMGDSVLIHWILPVAVPSISLLMICLLGLAFSNSSLSPSSSPCGFVPASLHQTQQMQIGST